MVLKKEIRVLGVDDSPFEKRAKQEVLVIGTFFRGGESLDGVLSTWVQKDGNDSTQKLAEMIKKSKFYSHIQFVMLDGIAMGGFNIVDIHELSTAIDRPVIVIMRQYPDFQGMEKALETAGLSKKNDLLEKLAKPVKVGKVYVQWVNTTLETVEQVLSITCTRSHIPEPVRAAHIIGSGVVKGESSGQA